MDFLMHFQFPFRYENGTHLLTSLKKSLATHILDHIHEWRHRCRLIKIEIPDQLLTEWFTKYFVPKLTKDIAMGGCVIEEEVITHA